MFFFHNKKEYAKALDGVSNIFSILACKLMLSSYTGPAIRIRRDVDNAETDINFNSSGVISIDDINTFLLGSAPASTQAFVSRIYDQSGNGYDATQSTAAKQPTINVSATAGTRVMNFTGTQTFSLPSQFNTLSDGAYTSYSIVKASSVSTAMVLYALSSSGALRACVRFNSNPANYVGQSGKPSISVANSASATKNDFNVYRFRRTGTTQAISHNGSVAGSNTSASNTTDVNESFLCSVADSSLYLEGDVFGFIFLSASSTDAKLYRAIGKQAGLTF